MKSQTQVPRHDSPCPPPPPQSQIKTDSAARRSSTPDDRSIRPSLLFPFFPRGGALPAARWQWAPAQSPPAARGTAGAIAGRGPARWRGARYFLRQIDSACRAERLHGAASLSVEKIAARCRRSTATRLRHSGSLLSFRGEFETVSGQK